MERYTVNVEDGLRPLMEARAIKLKAVKMNKQPNLSEYIKKLILKDVKK